MTLKDIKVSKNPIPVQPALWLRPMGGLSFKIYYPQGGNWVEVLTNAAPAEEQQHQVPVQETPEIEGTDLSELSELVENIKNAVNTLQNTVNGFSNSIKATTLNSQSAILTLVANEGTLVLPAMPMECKDVLENNLVNYNLTGELLDVLFSGEYTGVNILPVGAALLHGHYSLRNTGNTVILRGVFDSVTAFNTKIEVTIRLKRTKLTYEEGLMVAGGKPSAAYSYTVTKSQRTISTPTDGPGGSILPGGPTGGSISDQDPNAGSVGGGTSRPLNP